MVDSNFHTNSGPYSVGQIAELIECDIDSSQADVLVNDVASLTSAMDGDITFLDNVKYKSMLPDTKASVCILHPDMAEHAPDGVILLKTTKPYKAYAKVASMFYKHKSSGQVHPTAIVADSARIGRNVSIGAHTVIGDNVVIGDNCEIGACVTIDYTVIGDNVRIHNGARIGQDGFGFAVDNTGALPVPQLGRVVIEDHVNIGANTCIDRGSGPDTVIGAGTIIDNLVQIAHNVNIGQGCIIVAQVGIAGSTTIGNYCVFGGQSGVAGHLNIGQGVQVGAQAGVTRDTQSGQKLMGFPARPIREFWRDHAKFKKIISKS